jgi:hypothetical protein
MRVEVVYFKSPSDEKVAKLKAEGWKVLTEHAKPFVFFEREIKSETQSKDFLPEEFSLNHCENKSGVTHSQASLASQSIKKKVGGVAPS